LDEFSVTVMRTQTKLLIAIPVLMGIGFGVTYWLQMSKLRKEWEGWVPPRPAGETSLDPALMALEKRVRRGEFAALEELAQAYAEQGATEAAQAAYETMVSLSPDVASWWLKLGMLRGAGGQTVEAKAAVKRARELGLDSGEDYLRLGVTAERVGDQVSARDDYQRAVELDPSLLGAWLRLITLHQAVGDERATRQAMTAALTEHPDAVELRLMRARWARQRGGWVQALADFEHVRKVQPELPEPWYASAQALFALQRLEEGKALLDLRLAENPHDVTALGLLCVEALEEGNQAEADRLLTRLREAGTMPPREWARLVAAYTEVFGGEPEVE
jgi:tetratricopeptide (TPR) repeat protein